MSMTDPLLWPMTLHIALVVVLYAALTLVRAPAVWGAFGSQRAAFDRYENRISANLRNQFEWPLLFYVVVLLLMQRDDPVPGVQVTLAWVFVVGRLLHTAVQVFGNSVRLRGVVFTINFVAVLLMWGLLLGW